MIPDDFVPPRCPNRACEQHWRPRSRFFRKAGSYRPQCRQAAIPRFECKTCDRGFSFQTFRMDYRDKRPDLNAEIFDRLTAGATLRFLARRLRANCKSIQRKFEKLARHLRAFDRSMLPALPAGRILCLDEQEDFETTRTKPVTIPIVVDRASKFVVLTDVSPIRRMARRGSRARRRLERQERAEGRRRDDSRQCVRRLFGRLQRLLSDRPAELVTDAKVSYASEHRRRFANSVIHSRIPSWVKKDTMSPLFAVHLTQSMVRCSNARMRRRTWAKSKKRRLLELQLAVFAVFRNWHRQRTNADAWSFTPAVALGLTKQRIEVEDLVAWRQDWRRRSPHPLSKDGSTAIQDWVA